LFTRHAADRGASRLGEPSRPALARITAAGRRIAATMLMMITADTENSRTTFQARTISSRHAVIITT
jgi:hypothetical protein